MKISLILNNIRSNQNVGSIFRTADAAGVNKIYLCGYTPAPVDKFGRANKALSKSALGAEKFVEWEKVKSLKTVIQDLKKEKYKIIAVEQDKKAINLKSLKKFINRKSKIINLVLVFGNEVKGLSKKDLSLCDSIVEIPMRGLMVRQAGHPRNVKRGKESLNVAVVAGVVIFSLCS